MEDKLDQLAFVFFKLFAQYESELKEQGLYREFQGRVEADWDRFANERIGPDFLKILGDDAHYAMYVLDTPPKRQIVDKSLGVIWAEVGKDDKSVQALFGHVRRTRNNLFHGAKFNGTWFDPERSMKLLKSSIVILEGFRRYL